MKQNICFTNNLKKELFNIIIKEKPLRILFVTTNKSFNSLKIQEIINPIISNFKTKRFYEFDNNPKLTDVKKGVGLIKKYQPDLIIAIGGGSVIDMGKLINVLSNNENYKDLIKNNCNLKDSKIPMIAIPTTSGTGSESTSFAVLYINNKKYSVSNKNMLPNYAIIDSSLCNTMSKSLRAASAFDAFSQSIESYWSINSTIKSKKISLKAIKMINKNILNSFKKNEKARHAMAIAANLSGQAINITKTTAPHALSYYISTKHGIQHGHAVALTLGKFLILNKPLHNSNINEKRGYKFLINSMKTLYKTLGVKSGEEASKYWYDLMNKTGLESNISKACKINKNGLRTIIAKVDQNRLKNNPVQVTTKQLMTTLWNS